MAPLKTQLKLIQSFNSYNKKYWNSQLPQIPIEIQDIPKTYGEYWHPEKPEEDTYEEYKIIINARMHWREKKSMRSTLLHEMCHHAVFVNNKKLFWQKKIIWHGKEWKKEMERIGFQKPITRFS